MSRAHSAGLRERLTLSVCPPHPLPLSCGREGKKSAASSSLVPLLVVPLCSLAWNTKVPLRASRVPLLQCYRSSAKFSG